FPGTAIVEGVLHSNDIVRGVAFESLPTPVALTDVTTAGQTRTFDFNSGHVHTLAANNPFTLNVTGPSGRAMHGVLHKYDTSGVSTGSTMTAGTGLVGDYGPRSAANSTLVFGLYWDGARAFLTWVNDTANGTDLRP